MKPTRSKTPGKLIKTVSKESVSRAPVRVYCRIRRPPAPRPPPIGNNGNTPLPPPQPCLRVLSPTRVRLCPPHDRAINNKPQDYSFREVFTPRAVQNEVFTKVALPLVENLIRGKNGLLFAYGVTGSGKTYTMTGEPHNAGIMPRCLDVIFQTIETAQARRFVFRPDRANMFDVQSDADAALNRQQQLHRMGSKSTKKNNSNPDLALSSSELSKVEGLDDDCLYSVFVTYIEIYNNIVYDLLEEGTLGRQHPLTKIMREDAYHNMYIHGVTEVEVKSREEALEAFYKGLKRKRMAQTSLNSESSRSHSVFTIRLVQAPIDSMGESVVQDKNMISVRQLSLVDLAGSERTSRTNNTGQRLREAGNINNSLMTLRSCLEALRENQQSSAPARCVPYRDAKITHLFKNFFDGEGEVRMVVCVNPSCEDYDETLQVMRFAEVAMEVEVARPRPQIDLGAGMTPGRRKANLIFKQARERINSDGRCDTNQLDIDLALVYSLGGDFPSLELNGSSRTEEVIQSIVAHLEMRIQRRKALLRDKALRDENFRSQLDSLVKSSVFGGTESASLKLQLESERTRMASMRDQLVKTEDTISNLQRRLLASEQRADILQQQLDDKEFMLNQKVMEKENQKRKFTYKIATQHDKMSKELEIKLREQQEKLKKSMKNQDDKIRLVTHILTSDERAAAEDERASAMVNRRSQEAPDIISSNTGLTSPNSKRGVAVANPRHRRSLSADAGRCGDRWLEHMPRAMVPSGTIMQARFPRRKSVTKLVNIKDITNSKTSNYCLINQEQDTDGELETKLYKGDVIPTSGGGAQVIFSDVEMLSQMEPLAGKKREGGETPSRRFHGNNDYGSKKPRV